MRSRPKNTVEVETVEENGGEEEDRRQDEFLATLDGSVKVTADDEHCESLGWNQYSMLELSRDLDGFMDVEVQEKCDSKILLNEIGRVSREWKAVKSDDAEIPKYF
jgi:hypothetical protein